VLARIASPLTERVPRLQTSDLRRETSALKEVGAVLMRTSSGLYPRQAM